MGNRHITEIGWGIFQNEHLESCFFNSLFLLRFWRFDHNLSLTQKLRVNSVFSYNGESDTVGEQNPASMHRPRRSRWGRRNAYSLGRPSFHRRRRRTGHSKSSAIYIAFIIIFLFNLICYDFFFTLRDRSSTAIFLFNFVRFRNWDWISAVFSSFVIRLTSHLFV